MPTDTCTKRKKIYEEARKSISKEYRDELEDLRVKNRILLEENMKLHELNNKLVIENKRLESERLKYPQTFIELLSLYERLL